MVVAEIGKRYGGNGRNWRGLRRQIGQGRDAGRGSGRGACPRSLRLGFGCTLLQGLLPFVAVVEFDGWFGSRCLLGEREVGTEVILGTGLVGGV